jgi:DNA-directed RNA polymerase subunit H (RpoH/RPB5)
MGIAEVEEFLRREHTTRGDLPVIYTNDAQIVWNGGREGQVVEITRDSQTAGTALYYRRIERAAI